MAEARRRSRSSVVRRQELQEQQILEIVAAGIRPRIRTGRKIRQIASDQVGLRHDSRRDDTRIRGRRRNAGDEDVG